MTKKDLICSCCRKHTLNLRSVSLPVLKHEISGKTSMEVANLEICADCAKQFLKLYYDIAEKHNHSGYQVFEFKDQ